MRNGPRRLLASIVILAGVAASHSALAAGERFDPIVITEQGSFMAGGKVVTAPGTFDPLVWNLPNGQFNPAGQTISGDHAFAFYQVPQAPRKLPLVMWHGGEQSMKSWQTTPDGREGFQTIFLRRGWPVYLVDQPRRGEASRSTVPVTITPTPDEQANVFGMFRIGMWPKYFDGVQFSRDPSAVDQFFRWRAMNTGPFDLGVVSDGVSAVVDKVGPSVLITHSQSGGPGWLTAIKNRNIRGIVSFEPGSNFVFPQGQAPAPIRSAVVTPIPTLERPWDDFMRFTKVPILIIYGDNIPAADSPSNSPGPEGWRLRVMLAKLWRDAVNKRGGDVTVIQLPEIGIRGNTHFPFADLNNVQVADVVSRWLREKELDGRQATAKRSPARP